MKKGDSLRHKPKHLSIVLSYLHPQKKTASGEKKAEIAGQTKIQTPTKKRKEPVQSAQPKEIKRTTKTKTIKPAKKSEPPTHQVIRSGSQQEHKVVSQLPPEPKHSEFETQTEFKRPEIPGKEIHVAAVPTSPPPPVVREAIPLYRKNPSPKYPRLARRRGYQGTVVIEALINREGKVEDLRLFHSSGYRVLDRAAMKSVKNWLFEPGRKGDEEVEMWVKIPVRFQLR
jgi:TonB family protein